MMLFSATLHAQTYKAGTYTCNAKGYNGDAQIQVMVSDKTINAILVLKNGETAGIGGVPIDLIAQGNCEKTVPHSWRSV